MLGVARLREVSIMSHQRAHLPSPFLLSLRAEESTVILRFVAITLLNKNTTVKAMTGSG